MKQAQDPLVQALEEMLSEDWTLVSGSIGPLMDAGWSGASEVWKRRIRAALDAHRQQTEKPLTGRHTGPVGENLRGLV